MKTNVLIFPAGEINSVELLNALSHQVNIRVFGASSVDRHGSYVFKNYRGGLPFIGEDDFIPEFNKLIEEWNIDFVFPTHDTIALYLAENSGAIRAKIIVAEAETALVCRDKKETYKLFNDCEFCPQIYNSFDSLPVFIKPQNGQGAQGACLINRPEDIPGNIIYDDYVITEFLPGEELTVDCLTDSDGKLCACLPRIRRRLLAGVCVAGEAITVSDEVFEIGKIINSRLKFLGLWYFQLKKDVFGRYKLLEISTRCAGTMCLSRARGVNLPLLSVYAALGKKVSVFENPYELVMDRTLISRYKIDYEYDTVYIDYDDTLVEGNEVCLPVIRFIYQCRNKGKKIVLITRHEADHNDSIEQNLEQHAISVILFDEIVKLSFEDSKAEFIDPQNAIFIDNAYSERKEVFDRYRIPVFDIEGMDVLTDWRC